MVGDPDVFHDGEHAVQRRAGVADEAARIAFMVTREIPPDYARFLASESFVYVACAAPTGAVWTSVLFGRSGFAHATSPTRIEIDAPLADADPLTGVLDAGPSEIGMLVIEPMTRGRVRLNGVARRTPAGLCVELREAFGNCPKYIQRRRPVALATPPPGGTSPPRVGSELDGSQQALIRTADTFVLGSRHREGGADASHRGGRPGFVVPAADGRGLTFPDYQGNNMFKTLGNLTLDPSVGLLFVDWETGRTLQLSGSATIDWESERVAAWPGAQRLIDVGVESVIDRADGLPVVWELIERHRLNPPVPAPDTSPVPR